MAKKKRSPPPRSAQSIEAENSLLASFDAVCRGIQRLQAEKEDLRDLVRRAVEMWGDYAPRPQSKAAKVLAEMKALVSEWDESSPERRPR